MSARPVDGELVPCPTCWLPADLVGPTDVDSNFHSRCPRGHDNALVPAVLSHLRSLTARDVDRPA